VNEATSLQKATRHAADVRPQISLHLSKELQSAEVVFFAKNFLKNATRAFSRLET
jgi:hypothetical protein